MKCGALLLLVVAILLIAGCTQQEAVPAVTTTLTPTQVAPATTAATVQANETLKTEMAALAGKFAGEIDGKGLAAVLAEGPNSTAFENVLGQLKTFKASDSRIVYLYTLEQVNGTVRFIVDADYGQPEGSEYLEEYPDAPAELKGPVNAPIGVGPYTDQWGTFVSGFAPVDTGSNVTVIIIGVDTRV
jgi:hypothetical protein